MKQRETVSHIWHLDTEIRLIGSSSVIVVLELYLLLIIEAIKSI